RNKSRRALLSRVTLRGNFVITRFVLRHGARAGGATPSPRTAQSTKRSDRGPGPELIRTCLTLGGAWGGRRRINHLADHLVLLAALRTRTSLLTQENTMSLPRIKLSLIGLGFSLLAVAACSDEQAAAPSHPNTSGGSSGSPSTSG